jgi:hypothetical protein
MYLLADQRVYWHPAMDENRAPAQIEDRVRLIG